MRLLIVEDNPHIVSFMREALEGQGYTPEVVSDGQKAIDLALAGQYEMILLDVLLPGLSGLEVCQRLRDQGSRVPILMLTALDSVADRVKGLEAGADDYLCKPFAVEELVARVRALLRRVPVEGKEPVLKVADLTLDRSTWEVRRAGRLVSLTQREFTLLEYLMQCHGRVASRESIEEQVWGYTHDPLTNVVDVYIGRLRQKLDLGQPQPLIQTVRGVGYRLKS